MRMIKTIKTLPYTVAAAALLAALPAAVPVIGSSAVMAQEAAPKPAAKSRKVPALSLDVHKQIQKAQEAIDAKNYTEAEAILREVLAREKINDYERAVAWQINAMLAFEKDDTKGTIRAYEQILKYAESIPEALELQIMFGLAQLYFSEENYQKALQYVKQWEPRAEVVGATQILFIGQLHYALSDYKKCVEYVNRAITDAQNSGGGVEVKESWYQLLMSAQWEQGNLKEVRDILEILVINWPKPVYWTQLAGIFGELGQETVSFSLTEAAYKQGFLDDKPQQIVNVAQIQIARQAPIKAAWILEKAFKDKRVEKTGDNQKLLGQAYMLASEWRKAVAPLEAAAKASNDGDLWLQAGQVLMQLDKYAEALEAFDGAIKVFSGQRAGEQRDRKLLTAQMQSGQAHTELKQFKQAEASFSAALKLARADRDRKTANQWIAYMKAEKAREDMLEGKG
ncbi:tetratricopeptide repeat protein [Pseudokordiimonas caeni]|uniref:tetratricopeptide repeat protein n=1 Tax=Pseudokordiimonas caeni TaxID=2997908 RepID=UPI002812569A|nr:tetratricopeptide repeat protein [Pseudokordiimonas caeni]